MGETVALFCTKSVGLNGIDGALVQVEADLAQGLPNVTIVGLGDTAVMQARDRVRAAIVNSGQKWPPRRITISLSPASVHKRGSSFDVAMAVAILAADSDKLKRLAGEGVWLGELGLDGSVRPVHGVLPSLLAARQAGVRVAVVPMGNLAEASLVVGLRVWGAQNLRDVVRYLRGDDGALSAPGARLPVGMSKVPDMADVLGQPEARAALELAAAGGHHLSMIGPPGAGKTMLASRLPGILPPLTDEQSLLVTAVHSVAGVLSADTPLVTVPPFIDPHHTASATAIIGGGSGMIRPGSISLAHQGVLFLDEAAEFPRRVLDSLRQPMESGEVLIARVLSVARYPARFQLVLASNPCGCAAARDIDCSCPAGARRRYSARLSGPLMDRVDIRISLPALDPVSIASSERGEGSASILQRVLQARQRSTFRWRGTGWTTNSQVPGSVLRQTWRPQGQGAALLDRAVRAGLLTGRGYDRVLRLALTSADLGGREVPVLADISTALGLRSGVAA